VIGKRVVFGDPEAEDVEWITIVGVVGNTRQFGLDQPPRPEIYQPYLQGSLPYMTLVVKSGLDTGALTTAVRRAVMEVDPEQPLAAVATLEQVLFNSVGSRRFNMMLLGVFAVAALVLAAVGLYGVLSFSVAQRSNEIGIRMALGANASGVVGGVMREGVGLTLTGLAIGTVGALALTRLMSSMIHGVSATDPATFAAGVTLLVAMAALASGAPALRAARLDPMRVLRSE
jgi:putative ABC transport system permease protein